MNYRRIFLSLCTIIIAHNLLLIKYVNTTEWNILDPLALRSPKEWQVPDPPKKFRAKSNAPKEMTLWWEPPTNFNDILVRGYTLSYGNESSTKKIILEGVNTNSFTITGLSPNTTYSFILTAYNEAPQEDSEQVLLSAKTLSESEYNSKNIQLLPPTLLNWQPTKIFDEIMVKWTDPNNNIEKKINNQEKVSTLLFNENEIGGSTLKKFYILQYIPKKKNNKNTNQKLNAIDEQRITTDTTSALISNLKPGNVYEIRVRIVLPHYGTESDWSETLFVNSLLNSDEKMNENKQIFLTPTPAFGIQRKMEFCDFESISICDFINDDEATITWRRQIIKNEQNFNQYSIVIEYPIKKKNPDIENEYKESNSIPSVYAFGRLLSPVYDLQKSEKICISFRYKIRPISFGAILKMSLLFETDDWSESILLFRKTINDKFNQNYNENYYNYSFENDWKNLSFEAKTRPRQGFQVIFEVIKNQRDSNFQIAIDDIKVAARSCFGINQLSLLDDNCYNFFRECVKTII